MPVGQRLVVFDVCIRTNEFGWRLIVLQCPSEIVAVAVLLLFIKWIVSNYKIKHLTLFTRSPEIEITIQINVLEHLQIALLQRMWLSGRWFVHSHHRSVLDCVHQMHTDDCSSSALGHQNQIVSLQKAHESQNTIGADLLAVAPHGDEFAKIARVHFARILIDAQLIGMGPIDVEHSEFRFLVIAAD